MSDWARLLGELMPVSVAVAGPGAAEAAQALRAAGADAVALGAGEDAGGHDLAVLLAEGGAGPAMRGEVAALTAATDRILLVPAAGGGLAEVTAWFELFAEQGFQPVLDFDAGFLGSGAFLVDRNAVAAEAELAEFADRLAPAAEPAAPVAPPVESGEVAALRQRVTVLEAEGASLTSALAEARREIEAWAPLRRWVEARVRAPRRRGLRAWFGGRRARAAAEEAAIREAELFDPAWYIASHPELAAAGDDPVPHYRRHAATHDPGPWFDTAAYLREHPEVDPARINPLLHMTRRGR